MIRIKKAGWIYILLTISLGIGAVNTGNNLLYIIVSAFLSFMALSGFFGKRNITNLDLDIEFPEEIYASREAMIRVTLRNRRRFLPAFLIRVKLEGKDILYPFLDPRKDLSRYIRIAFLSRGAHRIGDIHICSVFPFNFFMRCRVLRLDRTIIVFPEPKECSYLDYDLSGLRKKGEEESEERGYEGDLLSLRSYVPGDPVKYIHWKATAKTDQLKTKELSSLMIKPTVIDVDRISGRIEERLSCATYLILRYSRIGLPFTVRIKGKVFRSEGTGVNRSAIKREVLKELALY